jgi:osmotically-inducible protein OsmY
MSVSNNRGAHAKRKDTMNTSAIPWPLSTPEIAGALARQSQIPRGVSVTVRDGHITLEGVVGWNYERVRAERAVKHLRGVRSVFNNILIKPYDYGSRGRRRSQVPIRSRSHK